MEKPMDVEKRKLVEENLGLVRTVMESFRIESTDEDLYAAGCLGLCRAAAGWSGGAPFRETAAYAIRRQILESLLAENEAAQASAALPPTPGIDGEACCGRAEARLLLGEIASGCAAFLSEEEARAVLLLLAGDTPGRAAQKMGVTLGHFAAVRRNAALRLRQWTD